MHKLPGRISTYIRYHFGDDYRLNIHSKKFRKGRVIYEIEVGENKTVHFFQFDGKGNMMKHGMEPECERTVSVTDEHGWTGLD